MPSVGARIRRGIRVGAARVADIAHLGLVEEDQEVRLVVSEILDVMRKRPRDEVDIARRELVRVH